MHFAFALHVLAGEAEEEFFAEVARGRIAPEIGVLIGIVNQIVKFAILRIAIQVEFVGVGDQRVLIERVLGGTAFDHHGILHGFGLTAEQRT